MEGARAREIGDGSGVEKLMADAEDTGGGFCLDSKSENTGTMTNIDAALEQLSVPKQNQAPEILPVVNGSHGDTLVDAKVSDEQKDAAKALVKRKRQSWPAHLRTRMRRKLAFSGGWKVAAKTLRLLGISNAAAPAAEAATARPPILGSPISIMMELRLNGHGRVALNTATPATAGARVMAVHIPNGRRTRRRVVAVKRPNAAAAAPAIANAVGDAEDVLSGALRNINPEMVRIRIAYLRNQEGLQDQPLPREFSIKYRRKVVGFIRKLENFSLLEILSEEMNAVFLQQLLNHILINGAETATNSTPAGIPQDPLPQDTIFESQHLNPKP